MQTIRKLAITPFTLYIIASYFDFNNSMQAAMWALFLVAFFSVLRESNLVVDSKAFSPKVLHRRDLIFTPHRLRYPFTQHSLSIPLRIVPGSVLCPVAALHTHLRLNRVPPSAPLFSVCAPSSDSFNAITYPQFAAFLATSLRAIGADSTRFPPHSFRRRGATFTFECGILAELIKLQGDWKSDAHLVYLETSDPQKRAAVVAMAKNLQSLRLIPPTLKVSEFIVFSSFVAVLFFVGLTIKLHISQTLLLSVFEW